MQQYIHLMNKVLINGKERTDRTGTGTISLFGPQIEFKQITRAFPLLTTKKMFTKGVIHELLWLLSGDTNIKYLQDNGVGIWDEWADKNGYLGPVYGKQWRKWEYYDYDGDNYEVGQIDQITQVIESIKDNPHSRRHIVSAWNVADISLMSLPCCHVLFQFYVEFSDKGEPEGLSCHMYQRSADYFLVVPFNIASYALLTMMVAHVTGLEARSLTISFGDCHIYTNHIEQCKEQMKRPPIPPPVMHLNKDVTNIFDFKYEDFELRGYKSHPTIKAPIST